MINQDTLESRANLIYIALGSNLGNKRNNIEKAKFKMIKENINILQTSSFYESLSWPNPKNPKFLNVVLRIATTLNQIELLNKCKEIELKLGRKKTAKNSPRVCDIDLIDYNMTILNDKVILPHPRMQTRNFVLLPLFEINKNWIHPISKLHVKTLILRLPNSDIRSIKQL